MNTNCGCCEGTEILTPMLTANRPGLNALSYRVGTHATFLETMKARLSSLALDIPTGQYDSLGNPLTQTILPLVGLTTREPSDPSIALLDSWAMVADILTFYQERIANEGYLRTATERRSILELARLIGYALRPGVASTLYLAYTIDEDRPVTPPKSIATIIPAGSRVQSVPGPGELPQSFETSDPLKARSEWNELGLRMTLPQTEERILDSQVIYLKGISTNLKPNDPLLIVFEDEEPEPVRVVEVKLDTVADRTQVTFRWWTSTPELSMQVGALTEELAPENSGGGVTTDTATNITTELAKLQDVKTLAGTVKVLEESVLPALANENLLASLPPDPLIYNQLDAVRRRLARRASVERASSTSPAGMAITEQDQCNGPVAVAGEILTALQKSPSIAPARATDLGRSPARAFAAEADVFPRLLTTFNPALQPVLYSALENANFTPCACIKVYALRVKASLFGYNAPRKLTGLDETTKLLGTEEWGVADMLESEELVPQTTGSQAKDSSVVFLDAAYDEILPGSWIVVDSGGVVTTADSQFKAATPQPVIAKALGVNAGIARADYGISGKSTRIELALPSDGETREPWVAFTPVNERTAGNDFQIIRRTVVFAESELLALAEEPITEPLCGGGEDDPIELDGLYDGLEAGRWFIVSGERSDVPGTSGVKVSELLMLAAVRHTVRPMASAVGTKTISGTGEADAVIASWPGDKTHTFLTLSAPLAYCYKRDTVTIYGNVIKATHGETRKEVLGNGDASKASQTFSLRQPPLTYLPAPTPAGAASTLSVRVNEVEWHEVDTLADLLPTARSFITQTDDDGKTKVIFGNGREGARPPTGSENITAIYRNGIGKPGNIIAEQASLLVTRPLGVKEVINPLRATGGADRESRDQARKNAPLALYALDRLISPQDYAHFSRTFAGIGKASAARLSDGSRLLVHVTVAGTGDIPIDKLSDLYRNLVQALRDFGDPYMPLAVEERELILLVISAKVSVLPDYQWELVEPKVRAALLEAFGFERRDLGQSVTPSEVISVIQQVAGVQYVDLDYLQSVDQASAAQQTSPIVEATPAIAARVVVELDRANPDRATNPSAPRILPAQLAILSPHVPDTLILNQVTQ